MQIALNLALSSPAMLPAAAPVPLQVVGSRGEMQFAAAGARTSSNNLQVARTEHFIGSKDVSELRIALHDYMVGTDNTGEASGDGYTGRFNVEYNGLSVRVMFGGQRNGVVSAGAAMVVSDAILPSSFGVSVFPAGARIWLRGEREYAVGARSLFHRTTAYSVPVTDERYMSAPAGTASLLDATGTLAATGGYTAQTHVWLPLAILGRPVSPMLAVGAFGASIEDGSGDGSGVGLSSGGYLRRALFNLDGNGKKVARVNLATPGETGGRFILSGDKRRAVLPYINHAVFGYGGNDYSIGVSLEEVQDRMLVNWASAKTAGAHVTQVSMSPKTDGDWTTAAGQTPRTGWAVGAPWYAENARIASLVASNADLDGFLDLWATQVDASLVDRWKANSTSDGTHPNATMASAMAATAKTYFTGLAATYET